MRVSEVLLTLDGLVLAFMSGWGLLVMYLDVPDFKLARRLFCGSVVATMVMGMIWDITSNSNPTVRILVAGFIFAVSGVLLSEALRWTYRHELNGTTPATSHIGQKSGVQHALTNIANTVVHVLPAKIGITGHAPTVKVAGPKPAQAGTAQSVVGTSVPSLHGLATSGPSVAPRLVISRSEFVPMNPADANSDQSVRFYYRNKGSVPAVAPVTVTLIKLTDAPISDDEVSSTMRQVREASYNPEMYDKDRAEADLEQEYYRFALNTTIKGSDLQEVKAGKKYFYLFVAMAYATEDMPHNEFWTTEYASMQVGDITQITILRSKTQFHRTKLAAP